ncbi:MAG: magnesium and cobalt transport protein CorA, partial [Deltaproteobacteria bacterium]|nr:magnesium and cobalt transport protein CorA [Deltaproteobacteria bacterium]
MRRHGKKRSVKSGLPPGTLVHIGEKSDEEVNVTVIDYDEGSFLEKTLG